ncbi:hypothetical protein [Leifsonia poae]|uniref:hypothetical protein n=1 Tax=Leifsonia poae TaxID=110933 RepID=UPI001CBF22D5|nr:hypothetical protein [Leifsonia poae]
MTVRQLQHATPTVLRIPERALQVPRDGDDSSGYTAWLTGPAGAGTARLVPIVGTHDPYDLIIIDYDGDASHSRSWVRHSQIDRVVVYTLIAASAASFPSPVNALSS